MGIDENDSNNTQSPDYVVVRVYAGQRSAADVLIDLLKAHSA